MQYFDTEMQFSEEIIRIRVLHNNTFLTTGVLQNCPFNFSFVIVKQYCVLTSYKLRKVKWRITFASDLDFDMTGGGGLGGGTRLSAELRVLVRAEEAEWSVLGFSNELREKKSFQK